VKKLYAGPWVGEWGWELCSWNPSIRHIAKEYDHVTVEIQPDMEYLYEFADEIIINAHTANFDMYSGSVSKPAFVAPKDVDSITPMHFWHKHARTEFRAIKHANRGNLLHPKAWRKYGTEEPKKVADIMCAWRGKKHYKGRSYPEKQYPDNQCIELTESFLEAGYSVACYGEKDNLYVEGTLDFRGVPLVELCGALSRTELAIGPSSGTIHLASLCGAPHVTWYGRPVVSMDRYLSYWNPFEAPVTFLDGSCPAPDKAFLHGVERMDPNTENMKWVRR
jgi:hypothetical protein